MGQCSRSFLCSGRLSLSLGMAQSLVSMKVRKMMFRYLFLISVAVASQAHADSAFYSKGTSVVFSRAIAIAEGNAESRCASSLYGAYRLERLTPWTEQRLDDGGYAVSAKFLCFVERRW